MSLKIFFISLLLLLIPFTAIAQNDISSQGLSITPFLIEAEVEKGKRTESEIEITNRSNSPVVISTNVRDFLPGKEGQPTFVPDAVENDPTFSLSSWISIFGSKNFTMKPNEKTVVRFAINPPIDAEQGTHYGAMLFSYASPGSLGSASEITQSVGTIILVRYGQAREGGLIDFQVPRTVYWNPDKITLTNIFKNTGNVHVKPKGEVYIKNMFGKIVATPFTNKDAVNVLPKTDRTFISSWIPSSTAFGRYTMESVVTFGDSRLESREKIAVWILPFYVVAILAVLLITFLWVLFHGRHWHRRRIIARHQKNIS